MARSEISRRSFSAREEITPVRDVGNDQAATVMVAKHYGRFLPQDKAAIAAQVQQGMVGHAV